MKAAWILFFSLTMAAPALSLAAEPGGAGLTREAREAAVAGRNEITNCQDMAAAVRESVRENARENQAAIRGDLRQIKHDLARLQQKLDEPGLGQIFSGIGYIFGLFGVAAFVASRKNRGR